MPSPSREKGRFLDKKGKRQPDLDPAFRAEQGVCSQHNLGEFNIGGRQESMNSHENQNKTEERLLSEAPELGGFGRFFPP